MRPRRAGRRGGGGAARSQPGRPLCGPAGGDVGRTPGGLRPSAPGAASGSAERGVPPSDPGDGTSGRGRPAGGVVEPVGFAQPRAPVRPRPAILRCSGQRESGCFGESVDGCQHGAGRPVRGDGRARQDRRRQHPVLPRPRLRSRRQNPRRAADRGGGAVGNRAEETAGHRRRHRRQDPGVRRFGADRQAGAAAGGVPAGVPGAGERSRPRPEAGGAAAGRLGGRFGGGAGGGPRSRVGAGAARLRGTDGSQPAAGHAAAGYVRQGAPHPDSGGNERGGMAGGRSAGVAGGRSRSLLRKPASVPRHGGRPRYPGGNLRLGGGDRAAGEPGVDSTGDRIGRRQDLGGQPVGPAGGRADGPDAPVGGGGPVLHRFAGSQHPAAAAGHPAGLVAQRVRPVRRRHRGGDSGGDRGGDLRGAGAAVDTAPHPGGPGGDRGGAGGRAARSGDGRGPAGRPSRSHGPVGGRRTFPRGDAGGGGGDGLGVHRRHRPCREPGRQRGEPRGDAGPTAVYCRSAGGLSGDADPARGGAEHRAGRLPRLRPGFPDGLRLVRGLGAQLLRPAGRRADRTARGGDQASGG